MFVVLCGMVMAASFTACGGGDDGDDDGNSGVIDNGGGGNGGGGGVTPSTSNIVGTWWIFFQSNDSNRGVVYNLLTFKSDYTGELIEEVGYGSDNANPFAWTQSGNTIRITLSQGNYAFNVEIVETVDNSTMIVNTIVNNKQGYYTVYKMSDSNLVSKDILGSWQTYKARFWGKENGEKFDETFNISPSNTTTSGPECSVYVFSDDASYKRFTYYQGDWLPHGPYLYSINRGRIFCLDRYTSGSPYISSEVTKSSTDEMIITEFYYDKSGYGFIQYNLRRIESFEGYDVDLGRDDYDSDTNLNNK